VSSLHEEIGKEWVSELTWGADVRSGIEGDDVEDTVNAAVDGAEREVGGVVAHAQGEVRGLA
jgi:hypothetical protein